MNFWESIGSKDHRRHSLLSELGRARLFDMAEYFVQGVETIPWANCGETTLFEECWPIRSCAAVIPNWQARIQGPLRLLENFQRGLVQHRKMILDRHDELDNCTGCRCFRLQILQCRHDFTFDFLHKRPMLFKTSLKCLWDKFKGCILQVADIVDASVLRHKRVLGLPMFRKKK